MAYWVKWSEEKQTSYNSSGDEMSYIHKKYRGPFRSLRDAEYDMYDDSREWEVLEFE